MLTFTLKCRKLEDHRNLNVMDNKTNGIIIRTTKKYFYTLLSEIHSISKIYLRVKIIF